MLFSTFLVSSALGIAQPAATTTRQLNSPGERTSPFSYAFAGFLFLIAIFGGGILHILKLGANSVTKKKELPTSPETDPYPANHVIDDV